MPFKSKAQRRKFAQLLVEGKISDETYEESNRSTGRKELPERVTPKAAGRKTARKRKTAKKVAKRPTRRPAAGKKTTKRGSSRARGAASRKARNA